MSPRARLRGGASHEAKGRRGARSVGVGRVGPPATRRRLCVLRQIGDQLVAGLAARTIQRVFRDLGLPYLRKTRRRRLRQLKLFEKERPGDSAPKLVVRRGSPPLTRPMQ